MIGYYLALAWRSLRRNVVLTILMIVAIAFGVGASMTTLTVLHVLSADPIPDKSDRLFYVQLDPRRLASYIPGGEPRDQLTRRDGEALLRAHRGLRQALMTSGEVSVEPDSATLKPFQ
ncbi:MAG: ABC transporter permease, partial [Stenotrophomonas sp.]|nr:ABC transporter permease [Stenotrophomonas sp.]